MQVQTPDEQLLKQFLHGQSNALGELARRYELTLLGLARGMLGGRRDLALDAVQETWVRVIRFGHSFNGSSSVKTWLYRIAINQCRNIQSMQTKVEPATLNEDPKAIDAEPLQVAQRVEDNHVLHKAVQRLAADKRSVLLLCYHAGMTHEQAAEILEIPLGTLKSRLHAALEELRASLSSETTA